MTPILQCGTRSLVLDRPRVMGILNVTPDSFSDGGLFHTVDAAVAQAADMVAAGADVLDIGGESTRPGARDVGQDEELDRVLPVIEAIADRFDVVLSIDTSKPVVMREAAAAGVGMINDVRALQEPGALAAAQLTGLPVCLMHMQGAPRSMQSAPSYRNVVEEVLGFLRERRDACTEAGLAAEQLLYDPGFGFGKTLAHNVGLLRSLQRFCELGPVLIGLSRKRMIGAMLGNDDTDRTVGSAVAALECVRRGAAVVRVHDVPSTVQALAVHQAIEQ